MRAVLVACGLLLAAPAQGDWSDCTPTILVPPSNPTCRATREDLCLSVCDGEQKRQACAKQPDFLGCENFQTCSPAHLLSLLKRQSEFVPHSRPEDVWPGSYMVDAVNRPIHFKSRQELLREEIKAKEAEAEKLDRQNVVAEEVESTLKECHP